jgi:nucleotide-binding universal stress UspA family protein
MLSILGANAEPGRSRQPRQTLIAFDDSENAMRAVSYIAETFNPRHTVTLFSVVPDTQSMCEMNSPELTPYFRTEQNAFCTLEDQKRLLLQDAMKKAKELLVDAGFAEDRIELRLEKREKGVARDIVSEAAKGYDLVVLGKKGVSGVKDFLLGSISQKVLYGAGDISVLFVG